MEVFNRIKTLLDSEQIAFVHTTHEPTLTSEVAAQVRGDSLSSGAKAIVYKVEDEFYLFVFAADKKMNPKIPC